MKQRIKKMYESPETEVCENYNQPLMIVIGSGETTPEESDANMSFFDDDYDNGSHEINLWDED